MAARYRALLEQKLKELTGQPAGPLGAERHADPVDQVLALGERDISVTLADGRAKTARLVRAALDRLDSGDYGLCLDCDEPITTKRLDALPWAECCVACAEKRACPATA
jgi:DnaK suppressor protein